MMNEINMEDFYPTWYQKFPLPFISLSIVLKKHHSLWNLLREKHHHFLFGACKLSKYEGYFKHFEDCKNIMQKKKKKSQVEEWGLHKWAGSNKVPSQQHRSNHLYLLFVCAFLSLKSKLSNTNHCHPREYFHWSPMDFNLIYLISQIQCLPLALIWFDFKWEVRFLLKSEKKKHTLTD